MKRGSLVTLLNSHGLCDEPGQEMQKYEDVEEPLNLTGIIIDSRVVRFFGVEELWYKLLIDGRVGWVYENWVKKV